jgi:hypothetical protein
MKNNARPTSGSTGLAIAAAKIYQNLAFQIK